MRVNEEPRLPAVGQSLVIRLTDILREFARQLNGLSEDKIAAHHGALTTAPTTGTWMQGDYVTNSAPVEAGSAGSKYVINGWRCVASGTPGTWVQCRSLTGN